MKPASSLALLIAALLLPVAAAVAGGATWVFVDNSASIKKSQLTRTYAEDILNMLADGGPRQLYFSTIGPVGSAPWMLDSRDPAGFKGRDKVARTFDFAALTTPIAESLNRALGRPEFAAVDQVVLVSDMDPDHQSAGTAFHFDQADLRDLDQTLQGIDRWLAADPGHSMDLVLHGWDAAPRASDFDPGGAEVDPQALQCDLGALRAGGAGRRGAAGRDLVKQGLACLARKFEGRLRLDAINLKAPDGGRNEEGFRNRLCGVLRDQLQKREAVCGGAAAGEVSDISARIDINNAMMRDYLKDRLIDHWPKEVYADGMPRTLPPPLVNIGIDPDHGERILHFRLDQGRAAPQPFNYPVLTGTGRTPEGMVDLGPVRPERAMRSKEEMLDWAADGARAIIEAFVKEYYPLQSRLKKIWISDAKGNPIPDGLHFYVMYDAGAKGSGVSNVASTRGGVVQLRIPENFSAGQLFLTKPDGKTPVDSAFPISPKDVRAPRDIKGSIADNDKFRRTQKLLVCGAQPDKPDVCVTEINGDLDLSLNLQVGEGELSPWPLHESAEGPGSRLVREGATLTIEGLMPGSYVVDARVREARPRWLTRTEFPIDPDSAPEAIIGLLPDELADGFKSRYFNAEQRGGRFTLDRDSRTYLRGSAYYFERLLQYTGEQLAGNGDRAALAGLWTAIRKEVFGEGDQASTTERYARWLVAGLTPLDMVADGRVRPGAMQELLAMFNRFIDCNDARLDHHGATSTDFERAYLARVRRMQLSGLVNEPLFIRLVGQDPQCRRG